ncbi:MAG: hypothetical protein OEV66_03950 [Spirochaetia bacterium]|nr:hypothetical protein [Spirochaetia bacterium]
MLKNMKWILFSGFFFMAFSESSDKIISINYTQSEQKAVRVEMIEMDIAIRTIISMVSLDRTDRLGPWFQRLSVLQTESSLYHKKGISGAVAKWKKNKLYPYISSIQSQANETVKYLGKQKEQEFKDLQWDLIYDSCKKITENCRQCHKKSGIAEKIQFNP